MTPAPLPWTRSARHPASSSLPQRSQRDRDRTVERLPVVCARPVSVRRRTSRLLDLDSDLTIPSTLDLKQRLALAV